MTYQDTRTGLFDFLPGLEMMNWIRWGTANVGSFEVDLMIWSIVLLRIDFQDLPRISRSFMESIQQGPHLSKHHDLGIKLQFLTASLFQDIPRPHWLHGEVPIHCEPPKRRFHKDCHRFSHIFQCFVDSTSSYPNSPSWIIHQLSQVFFNCWLKC